LTLENRGAPTSPYSQTTTKEILPMKNFFINPEETSSFYLSADTDKKVEWVLQSIDALTMFYLRSVTGDTANNPDKMTELMKLLLKFGLKDVKGEGVPAIIKEKKNFPTIGEREVVSDEFMKLIRFEVFTELSNAVINMNLLSPEESKN
jgi:hypothetical protein